MQSDLNVCEPTFSPRSRVLKGRDDSRKEGYLVRSGYLFVCCFPFREGLLRMLEWQLNEYTTGIC